MTPDACLDYLHELHWSVGEYQAADGLWRVYGHCGNDKIIGRGPSESEARQAAVMAAESLTRDRL